MSTRLLMVEYDEVLADNVRSYLERHDWRVEVCSCGEEAMRRIEARRPDLILADQALPGISGVELLRRLASGGGAPKFVMMTGDASAQTAVEAMKAGALDYLTKPVALAELKRVLDRARGVGAALQADRGLAAFLGESSATLGLKSDIRQLLDAEKRMDGGDLPTVLVRGETGTGKELVARALHVDGGRRDKPFIEINCASIPAHLLEAELFGHEKGAFTDAKERKIGLVEAADGGTLFLDEIGEVDPAIQAKLLKLLEEKTVRRLGAVKERKVDLRIIGATNRDLEQMVAAGRFRSDLYFRLRIITLNVPPLRARGDDILLLARHYLAVHGRRYGRPGLMLSHAAERALLAWHWPGNVRELRNLLEQIALMAKSDLVLPHHLGLAAIPGAQQAGPAERPPPAVVLPPLRTRPSEIDRDLVVRMLEKTDWNVTKAARLLGMSRDMLRYRIEKLALDRPAE
jgi:two-component system, NtrC family, response regulator AtoC